MYRRNIGVVFQDFRLLKDRNIYENIAFAQRVTETSTRIIKKKSTGGIVTGRACPKIQGISKGIIRWVSNRELQSQRAIVNEPANSACR